MGFSHLKRLRLTIKFPNCLGMESPTPFRIIDRQKLQAQTNHWVWSAVIWVKTLSARKTISPCVHSFTWTKKESNRVNADSPSREGWGWKRIIMKTWRTEPCVLLVSFKTSCARHRGKTTDNSKGLPLGNLGRLKVLAGTLSFDSQLSSARHTLAVAHIIHNNNEVQKVYNKLWQFLSPLNSSKIKEWRIGKLEECQSKYKIFEAGEMAQPMKDCLPMLQTWRPDLNLQTPH